MTAERKKQAELYLLSQKINNLGGKYLDDKVLLDDLYNYSPRSGRARGNTPAEWNNVLANLDPNDKKRIMFAIGLVNRKLSKELGVDATLGDLRKTSIYQ